MKKYHEVHQITFSDDKLLLHVDDHHVECNLADVSPALFKASEEERNHFVISPSGYGIHWPLIDEDLSVDGLLGIVHYPEKHGLSA